MKIISIEVGGEQETVLATGYKKRGEVPSGPA